MSDATLRPAFYEHLGNAAEAAEAVDNFDLTDANRAEFALLEQAQADTTEALVDFILQHGDALKAQIKAGWEVA
jgi:hypothetical protein